MQLLGSVVLQTSQIIVPLKVTVVHFRSCPNDNLNNSINNVISKILVIYNSYPKNSVIYALTSIDH